MMKILELNTFHMHLSDDQGWRLEIEELPELTTFGAKRCYGNFTDGITNDFPCLWPEPQGERPLLTVGTAQVFVMARLFSPNDSPQSPRQDTVADTGVESRHFTRDEFKEILVYANDNGIKIVPEFDFPAHASAAIKSMEYRYYTSGDDKYS